MIKVAKICFTFFYKYNKCEFYFLVLIVMTDPKKKPVVAIDWTPEAESPDSSSKSSFFWGNEAVFDNLEKFEKITNPTPEDQNFDFSFEDIKPQEEKTDWDTDHAAPDFEELTSSQSENTEEEPLAPLQDIGLDTIFHPEESSIDNAEASTWEVLSEWQDWEEIDSSFHSEWQVWEELSEWQVWEEMDSSFHSEWQDWEELSEEEKAYHKMESEPVSEVSSLLEKYNELLAMSKHILKLQNKIKKTEDSDFEVIGNNTEKSMITYLIKGTDSELTLTRKEKDFARNEESEHLLNFSTQEENKNLIVAVDGVQLYEEEKDLQDPLKAWQVMEKLNKFHFLFSEQEKSLEEQWESIKAEKEKMKAFRDIFRNF